MSSERVVELRAADEASSGLEDPTELYLTDGVFLYRVVDWIDDGEGQMVALEDCYELDVVNVSVTDLRRRQLRTVTAG